MAFRRRDVMQKTSVGVASATEYSHSSAVAGPKTSKMSRPASTVYTATPSPTATSNQQMHAVYT